MKYLEGFKKRFWIDGAHRYKDPNIQLATIEGYEAGTEFMESRKCEDCKLCYKEGERVFCWYTDLDTPKDFNCKYWENKDE